MAATSQPSLPDTISWRFERIAAAEPARAAVLEAAAPPQHLLDELRLAFRRNLTTDHIRFASEESSCRQDDLRAIVQLHVRSEMFDRFFNARTGYRAHYRAAPEVGLKFNTEVIKVLRGELQSGSLDTFPGRRFDPGFIDIGEATITRDFLLKSLDSDISKVWLCTTLIGADGAHRQMATGTSDAKLLVDGGEWVNWCRELEDSWLEVKGAFLRLHDVYQPKDSWKRALRLHESGMA